MIFEWELNANKTTKELKENTPPYCAWCGGQCDQPRPFPNRRGELFCSASHRSSSNRALKRLLSK